MGSLIGMLQRLPGDDAVRGYLYYSTSAVCLEHVLRDQEIRELKCLHIFHKECLEKWYLKNHFNCPLCHRPYYAQETHPTNDYVWMV